MPRALWTGAISFGLVNVPVKLVTAVRKKNVRFNQLHSKDGARIQQRRVCSTEGIEVPYEEVAKGYEVSPGRYVMLEADELDSLDPEATRTIDIETFVSLDDIDPLFYDSSYYLEPGPHGEKAYRLLVEAMSTSSKVAIATFVLRNKEYLAALRPVGNALVLSTMNFADEIVPQSELDDLPGSAVAANERELGMAQQLIDTLSGDFEPERYHDSYRERLLELIERKAQGQEVVAAPVQQEEAAPVIDIMAALEASVAAASRRSKGPDAPADAQPEAEQEGEPEKPARRRRTRAS
jgi:DNA end-binding protein Ku